MLLQKPHEKDPKSTVTSISTSNVIPEEFQRIPKIEWFAWSLEYCEQFAAFTNPV